MRKSHIVLLLSIFILVNLAFSGTTILDFRAQPGFKLVTLKWTSESEINLKGFEIERSNQEHSNFKKVDFLKAKQGNQDRKEYEFEDKPEFELSARTYYYRLKIIDNDETWKYSKVISVNSTISSARQTWGSIKAMFR